ncbi:MAG TPA: DNRLRE domain-containing protein [Gaiellaceae bacterium]|nr:DNRLRE domain-containing protein [Gaiellaceae bacterium]
MRRRAGLVAAVAALTGAGAAAAASVALTSATLTTATKTLTRATCTLAPSQDAYVDSASSQRNRNFGTATSLLVTGTTSQVSFAQFDLAGCALPAGASVDSATLRLVVTAAPLLSRDLAVHRVTATWTETGITSSNQPAAAATATATLATGSTTGQRTTDVTADVDAFVRGAATNFGWRLTDPLIGATTTFGSRENTGNAPSLVVVYVH